MSQNICSSEPKERIKLVDTEAGEAIDSAAASLTGSLIVFQITITTFSRERRMHMPPGPHRFTRVVCAALQFVCGSAKIRRPVNFVQQRVLRESVSRIPDDARGRARTSP